MSTIEIFGLAILIAWICENMSKDRNFNDDYDETNVNESRSAAPLEKRADNYVGHGSGDNDSDREAGNLALRSPGKQSQQDSRVVIKI
jgi:hypothetical protein